MGCIEVDIVAVSMHKAVRPFEHGGDLVARFYHFSANVNSLRCPTLISPGY